MQTSALACGTETIYAQISIQITFEIMLLHVLLCLAVSCSILLITACTHRVDPGFATGASDLEEFILREAILRGGRPIRTNDLPSIDAIWRFAKDGDGVIIRMRSGSSESTLKFLREAFGVPQI